MNTATKSSRRLNRVAIVAALIALGIMGTLMVLSIVVSSDALSRGEDNGNSAASDASARCGMSQQTFVELPGQLQRDLGETCNRPPDMRP